MAEYMTHDQFLVDKSVDETLLHRREYRRGYVQLDGMRHSDGIPQYKVTWMWRKRPDAGAETAPFDCGPSYGTRAFASYEEARQHFNSMVAPFDIETTKGYGDAS